VNRAGSQTTDPYREVFVHRKLLAGTPRESQVMHTTNIKSLERPEEPVKSLLAQLHTTAKHARLPSRVENISSMYALMALSRSKGWQRIPTASASTTMRNQNTGVEWGTVSPVTIAMEANAQRERYIPQKRLGFRGILQSQRLKSELLLALNGYKAPEGLLLLS